MSETLREKLDRLYADEDIEDDDVLLAFYDAWPQIAAVLDAAEDLWENGDTEGAAERFYALGAALARLNEPAP